MLGFAWMLRNEAARWFVDYNRGASRSWILSRYSPTVTRYAELIYKFYKDNDPTRLPHLAALALLTAHNAEPRDEVNTHGR